MACERDPPLGCGTLAVSVRKAEPEEVPMTIVGRARHPPSPHHLRHPGHHQRRDPPRPDQPCHPPGAAQRSPQASRQPRRPQPMSLSTPAPRRVVLEVSCGDRKSTRLNSSHSSISYAVFCLKKKTNRNFTDPSSNKASRHKMNRYV